MPQGSAGPTACDETPAPPCTGPPSDARCGLHASTSTSMSPTGPASHANCRAADPVEHLAPGRSDTSPAHSNPIPSPAPPSCSSRQGRAPPRTPRAGRSNRHTPPPYRPWSAHDGCESTASCWNCGQTHQTAHRPAPQASRTSRQPRDATAHPQSPRRPSSWPSRNPPDYCAYPATRTPSGEGARLRRPREGPSPCVNRAHPGGISVAGWPGIG